MNPNIETHFAELPEVEIGRSKLNIPYTHLDTFNSGELVPELVMEVLPGDTIKMSMSSVVRMMTPIAPVMDNCFMDVSFWFVPNRLTWTNWKRFMGENETAPWASSYNGTVPVITINGTTETSTIGSDTYHMKSNVAKGSVADHMGIPLTDYTYGTNSTSINALPFRAYCLIWNEFFRDENLQNPVNINLSDATWGMRTINPTYTTEEQKSSFLTKYADRGGTKCLPVCKLHDYFTSALPQSQKGSAVTLPMNGTAPIVQKTFTSTYSGTTYTYGHNSDAVYTSVDFGAGGLASASRIGSEIATTGGNAMDYRVGYDGGQLFADLSEATGATITALRQSIQLQKFLEADARSGTRYTELLRGHFGVTSPDGRLQRPEYLGGFRQTINMNQVVQSTPIISDSTPLGTTGAYSVTARGDDDIFTWSSVEHGFLIGCICIRNDNTYQQGIDRMWFRENRYDYYWPEFANLSEQAILNREIYLQGTSADTEAFGYQEAWADYRFKPSTISGEMRSTYSQSLDIWHYGDYYTSKPVLGDKWIQSDKSNIQRTLAIQNHDQFMGDFYFDMVWTRPMPVYSIPGLMDHH